MKLVTGVLLGVLAMSQMGCGVASMMGNTYSSGYRDGYVRKVTKKGNLTKVWEIEAGFHNDSGSGWTANIDEQEVFNVIQQARGDDLVRLHYTERYVQGSDTTPYVIKKVEFLDRTLPHDRKLPGADEAPQKESKS